jgi:hypothetical protein
MNEIADLAQQAMNIIGPLLPLAATAGSVVATKAAEGFLSEPGAKLFSWLTDKFKGSPAAAKLDRAVAEPENKVRLAALQGEIEELAEKDMDFLHQLAEILEELATKNPGSVVTQSSTQTGDNNKSSHVAGGNNQIVIG